jgi:ribulose-5-phosphate 4-epimerase/fuculose-1-phosphate aldolase
VTDADLTAATAVANRALGAAGQSDMVWGHASLRDPGSRGVWMKASSWSFDEVGDDRVVLVSDDGEVVAGPGSRHIEYPIHTRVMAARPDVGCVVHTHSASATAFAALDQPLRAISHDGVEFAEPPLPRFTGTGSLIRTRELGDELAEAIGDGVGCLMPQHGIVTVGADAATAVMRAVLLDRACRTQLAAMAAGTVQRWSDSAELELKRAEVWPPPQLQAGYAWLCREADSLLSAGRRG